MCAVYNMREESQVYVKDSCFLNNDFTGEGTVTVQSASSVIDANGNFVSEDDGLRCPLLAIVGGSCEEATAGEDLCTSLEADSPDRRSGSKSLTSEVSSAANSLLYSRIGQMFLGLLILQCN